MPGAGYNNDPATYSTDGKLYNWYAVHDPCGLAPEDWHIPNDTEWTKLSNYPGDEEVAEGKMKSTGTIEDVVMQDRTAAENRLLFL